MATEVRTVTTPSLDIEVELSGPTDGPDVLLLHGWPDSLRTWDPVLPCLHARGLRTVVPSLRGCGRTVFRDKSTPRSGQVVALARDAFELADSLDIGRFSIVGHDWGARAVFDAAILEPQRLSSVVALSLGWKTPSAVLPLSPAQARAFWYQWYFATRHGEIAFRDDPFTFGRHLWDTWSPPGWYGEAAWHETSAAWQNPDWCDVVIHFYRSRWRHYQPDPAYENDEKKARAAIAIDVPTRVIYGQADTCCLAELAEGCEPFFPGAYSCDVLPGIGHFPQREAPEEVADLIADWVLRFPPGSI
jgi:pimeloyl-ACP methyl ester carboxylesterase